jgi:hypothetical protein
MPEVAAAFFDVLETQKIVESQGALLPKDRQAAVKRGSSFCPPSAAINWPISPLRQRHLTTRCPAGERLKYYYMNECPSSEISGPLSS